MAHTLPSIGDWYQKPGGDLFEVVALDDADGTIEIQYFDGTVEEVESEGWYDMGCLPAEAPEDYSGSLDITREDYAARVEVAGHKDWDDPLDFLDQSDRR
jgi:hypothetical protein